MPSPSAQIILDIKNRLESNPPYFDYPASMNVSKTGKFVFMWNNTVQRMREGKYAGLHPGAVFFLEVVKPLPVDQLGNGVRDIKFNIRVHCVHKFVNANDNLVWGDQDLAIFEQRDWAFKMLEMFQPSGCGVMTLESEEPDTDHDMIVDHIMEFSMKRIDTLVDQPINGLTITPTPALNPSMVITDEPYQNESDVVLTNEDDEILTPSI